MDQWSICRLFRNTVFKDILIIEESKRKGKIMKENIILFFLRVTPEFAAIAALFLK